MLLRQIHAYLSVFVAPTILFFAFTGALQLFSLHEAHGDYRPPVLIEKLGSLHKDQRLAAKSDHGPPHSSSRAPHAEPHHDDDRPPPASVIALKWLFLAAAVTLMASTLLGVWMAVTQNRRKGLLAVLFLAGALAPIAILTLL
jgi:hypothetical protein